MFVDLDFTLEHLVFDLDFGFEPLVYLYIGITSLCL